MALLAKASKALLPFLVAAVVVGLDQSSKAWVAENVALRDSVVILPWLDGWLNVTYIHNSGAAFGIFPQANLVFIIVALVVVAVILFYFRHLPSDGLLVRVSLGLQLGGAVGNLIDRLRFGYVIDFLKIGVTSALPLTTNNVADTAIVGGVILLGYYLLFTLPGRHALADHRADAPGAAEQPSAQD